MLDLSTRPHDLSRIMARHFIKNLGWIKVSVGHETPKKRAVDTARKSFDRRALEALRSRVSGRITARAAPWPESPPAPWKVASAMESAAPGSLPGIKRYRRSIPGTPAGAIEPNASPRNPP